MKYFKFNFKKWNFSHDTITCQDQTWLVYLTAFQKTLKQYLSWYAGPAVQSQFEIKMYYDGHIIQLFSTGKYFIPQATPDSWHYISIDVTQLNFSRILEVCNIGWDLLNNKKRFFEDLLQAQTSPLFKHAISLEEFMIYSFFSMKWKLFMAVIFCCEISCLMVLSLYYL